MNPKIRIIYPQKFNKEPEYIENVSLLVMNGRCVFLHGFDSTELDICLNENDNLDIKVFSEAYNTYEVEINY